METRGYGRLVVVDDEPVILSLLQSVLDRGEWEVAFASTGVEAKAAMDGGVDVLLTDKNLPDINGLELIRYARECTEDAEAIVLTGYASLDTALEALKLEAFDYIVKPPRDIFEVAKKVRGAFERQAIRRENRRLLAELSEKNAELERAMAELQRTQAELVQSEKLAGIGTLAAGVAHEISSPLFGIMGLAEAVADEDSLDEIREYASEIVSYSQSIKEIVVGLTGYARDAESEQHATVDLAAAASDAILLVERSGAAEAGLIELISAGPCWVEARQSELRQIFVNLVRNAIEATAEGGRVTVRVNAHDDVAVAIVEDDGAGLPPEQLSQVFDPFFTTKPPGQGTGLGLNIVYRLVTRHRGTILAENRSEGGARFAFRLPAAESP